MTRETTRVRIDGKITFPLLDDVQAAGLTTMELKQRIESGLAEFVESPTVTVTLRSPESKKFYILGEIQNTGEYQIIKDLRVMQAFALAGASPNGHLKRRFCYSGTKTARKKPSRSITGTLWKEISVKTYRFEPMTP